MTGRALAVGGAVVAALALAVALDAGGGRPSEGARVEPIPASRAPAAGAAAREDGSAALLRRGNDLYRARRHEEALEAYRALAEREPASSAAHYGLMMTYRALGDASRAQAEARVLEGLLRLAVPAHEFAPAPPTRSAAPTPPAAPR